MQSEYKLILIRILTPCIHLFRWLNGTTTANRKDVYLLNGAVGQENYLVLLLDGAELDLGLMEEPGQHCTVSSNLPILGLQSNISNWPSYICLIYCINMIIQDRNIFMCSVSEYWEVNNIKYVHCASPMYMLSPKCTLQMIDSHF